MAFKAVAVTGPPTLVAFTVVPVVPLASYTVVNVIHVKPVEPISCAPVVYLLSESTRSKEIICCSPTGNINMKSYGLM